MKLKYDSADASAPEVTPAAGLAANEGVSGWYYYDSEGSTQA